MNRIHLLIFFCQKIQFRSHKKKLQWKSLYKHVGLFVFALRLKLCPYILRKHAICCILNALRLKICPLILMLNFSKNERAFLILALLGSTHFTYRSYKYYNPCFLDGTVHINEVGCRVSHFHLRKKIFRVCTVCIFEK